MKDSRIQDMGAPMETIREIIVTRMTTAGPMEEIALLLIAELICCWEIPASFAAVRDFRKKRTD